MKQTLNSIQFLRGIAVLLVVLLHLFSIENKYQQHGALLGNIAHLGSAGVDIFFVISGFIMITITRDHPAGFASVRNFFLLRVTRIYPLYWIISLLVLLAFIVNPALVSAGSTNADFLLHSFLLLPQDRTPLLAVGWTLVHEMYFYTVFSLILFAPRRWHAGALFIWATTVLACHLFLTGTQNPWLLFGISPLTFEFLGGCLIAYVWHKIPAHRLTAALYLIAGIALPVWHWYGLADHTNSTVFSEWDRVIVFGIPAMMLLSGALLLEKSGGRFPGIMLVIGNASYAIYLTHTLILSLLGRLWQQVDQTGLVDNSIVLALMLLIALVGGWLCYRMIEQPLLRGCRRMMTPRT